MEASGLKRRCENLAALLGRLEISEQPAAAGRLLAGLVHLRLGALRALEEIVGARERHGAENGRAQVAERGTLADELARLGLAEILQQRTRRDQHDHQSHRGAHAAGADPARAAPPEPGAAPPPAPPPRFWRRAPAGTQGP